MKKNLISLAVAASVLGGAAVQAGQYVNPDKTGEVLLFPFFNADNGNATNMHIVNTTAKTKAIKVRFVEYKNSNEILDFNLYLSPKDHFAFGVIADPNGVGAGVITQDNSCTVPALGSANGAFTGTQTTGANGAITRYQPFVNYVYATTEDVDSSVERTMMGHVEVIEMGVVSDMGGVNPTTPTNKARQYASFAKHGATGVPANCNGLSVAWATPGLWATVASDGISAPTGGLYGLAYHINVGAAASFGFEPTAIDNWAAGQKHTDPGTETPAINEGRLVSTIHTGSVTAGDPYLELTNGNAAEIAGAQATSALLMTQSLTNDVMINPAIGGQTDWVVTFPTKRFHVDTAAPTAVVAPFTDNWDGSVGTTTKKEDPACEAVIPGVYNREELTQVGGLQFSPKLTTAAGTICNEVAVITMGSTGTASALSITTGQSFFSFPYAEGWMSLNFGLPQTKNAISGKSQNMVVGQTTLTGLPVIGFGAYKVNNGAMSYGNASEHKTAATNSAVGG